MTGRRFHVIPVTSRLSERPRDREGVEGRVILRYRPANLSHLKAVAGPESKDGIVVLVDARARSRFRHYQLLTLGHGRHLWRQDPEHLSFSTLGM